MCYLPFVFFTDSLLGLLVLLSKVNIVTLYSHLLLIIDVDDRL